MRKFGIAVIVVWSSALICEVIRLPATFMNIRFSSVAWQAGFFLVLATLLGLRSGFALMSSPSPLRVVPALVASSLLCFFATWMSWSAWPGPWQELVKGWLAQNLWVAYMNIALPIMAALVLVGALVVLLMRGKLDQ
jgi:hypothetical protein